MQRKTRIRLFAVISFVLLLTVIVLYTFVTFSEIKSKGIENWQADDISLSSVKGTCQARVYNPSWFSMNCKTLNFQLFYKDREVGKADLRTPTVLNGNEETLLPLSFEFEFSKFGFSDLFELAQDSIELKTILKGTATWMNFTFEEEGKITLSLKEWIKTKLPDLKRDGWFKWGAVMKESADIVNLNSPEFIFYNKNEFNSDLTKYFYLNSKEFLREENLLLKKIL